MFWMHQQSGSYRFPCHYYTQVLSRFCSFNRFSINTTQVFSETAKASMLTSPHLRDVILASSRQALLHIGPLALCAGGSERPAFLSPKVLAQIDLFLQDMAT